MLQKLTVKSIARTDSNLWTWLENPTAAKGAWLAGLVALVYVRVFFSDYVWDDDHFVTTNVCLTQGWEGLRSIWLVIGGTSQYYPMSYTSFWLEYQVWGFWAPGSHVINVLLHGLNAWLFWKVLAKLEVPGAGLAAILFALHPVHVESVAWITERKNVLSGAFYLLAVLAYLKFEPGLHPRGPVTRDWRWFGVTVLLFLAALWSKTVTCTLPAALGLLLWWKEGKLDWRKYAPLIPLLVIGAGLGLLTAHMEVHYIGGSDEDWHLSTPERFLLAGRAPWFYASKLVWPVELVFLYPRWKLDPAVWWQWGFGIGLLLLLLLLWSRRQKWGRGPLVGVLFFIGTLFPALGFVDVYPFRYSYVADHFQYLASLGLITLAGAGVACFLPSSVIPRRMAVLVPVSWLVLLSLKTVLQTGCYRDLFVFYEEIILQNPSCWMAHNNLSHLELSRGRVDRALSLSQEAVRLNPDDAESRVNLGNTLFVKGRAAEAISCYQAAIRLKPKLAQAYSDLGNALLLTGKSVDAISQFQKAIELSPTFPEGHNNLGYAYLMMGRTEEAREKFLEALRLNPDYRKARENLQEAEAQLKVKQYRAKTAR